MQFIKFNLKPQRDLSRNEVLFINHTMAHLTKLALIVNEKKKNQQHLEENEKFLFSLFCVCRQKSVTIMHNFIVLRAIHDFLKCF